MVEDLECTLKFQDQCEDGKAITQHKVKGKEGWPKEQASEAAQMQMQCPIEPTAPVPLKSLGRGQQRVQGKPFCCKLEPLWLRPV